MPVFRRDGRAVPSSHTPENEGSPMARTRTLKRVGLRVPYVGRVISERDGLREKVHRLNRERRSWKQERRALEKEVDRLRRGEDAYTDLGYLFIVTYGRSGSTLLQGIISSAPGYLVRGENRAMMDELYAFHRKSVVERERLARPKRLPPTHPFFGIDDYPDDIALRDIRRLAVETILRPRPDTRVVGYKEIRWNRPDLPEYLKFLQDVFPGARFVVNTRDIDAVAQSKWWARRANAVEEIKGAEETILAATEQLGDAAYRVHYDDYVDDPTRLRGLFTWLGLEFDEEAVRATMARPHSY